MKEKLKNDIINVISDSNLDIYDIIEVLANVFIMHGATYMDIDKNVRNEIELVDLVVQDIEENGETLPNALVRQGLLILSWLKKEEKEYE